MCKCLTEVEQLSIDSIKERNPKWNVLPLSNTGEDGVQNCMLLLAQREEGFDVAPRQLSTQFVARYTFQKNDGKPSQVKKFSASLAFSFCPFCGDPYKKPIAGSETKTA